MQPKQADMFHEYDADKSQRAQDEAIAQVSKDPSVWDELAGRALERVARRNGTFIATDVWKEMEATLGPMLPMALEPRRMGAVLRRANIAGLIIPTDRFIPTDSVTRHRSPSRVWRSLLVSAIAP